MDVSHNPGLEYLDCSNIGRLLEVNASNNPTLKFMKCSETMSLQPLDLTSCISLEEFECENSRLARLTLNNNPSLKKITCNNTQLSELYLAHCPMLEELYLVKANIINKIDISNNENIKIIDIQHTDELVEIKGAHNLPNLRKVKLTETRLRFGSIPFRTTQVTEYDISFSSKFTTIDASATSLIDLSTEYSFMNSVTNYD